MSVLGASVSGYRCCSHVFSRRQVSRSMIMGVIAMNYRRVARGRRRYRFSRHLLIWEAEEHGTIPAMIERQQNVAVTSHAEGRKAEGQTCAWSRRRAWSGSSEERASVCGSGGRLSAGEPGDGASCCFRVPGGSGVFGTVCFSFAPRPSWLLSEERRLHACASPA